MTRTKGDDGMACAEACTLSVEVKTRHRPARAERGENDADESALGAFSPRHAPVRGDPDSTWWSAIEITRAIGPHRAVVADKWCAEIVRFLRKRTGALTTELPPKRAGVVPATSLLGAENSMLPGRDGRLLLDR